MSPTIKFPTKLVNTIIGWIGFCFVVLFHPWILFGIRPVETVPFLRLPVRTRLMFMSLHITLLSAANILPRFFMPEWLGGYTVTLTETPWWVLLMWIGIGVLGAGITGAFMNDFFEPWWSNRLIAKRSRQNALVVPDRALDGVFAYDQDTIRFGFRKDAKAWLKINMRKRYGLVPMSNSAWLKGEVQPTVWFADPHDAFAFKLRWM